MICPACGKEMRKGYLFASKAKGFIEVTPLKPSHRTNIAAECCEKCRMIAFQY